MNSNKLVCSMALNIGSLQNLSFASRIALNSLGLFALMNKLLIRSVSSVVGIVLKPFSRILRTSISRSSIFLDSGAKARAKRRFDSVYSWAQ